MTDYETAYRALREGLQELVDATTAAGPPDGGTNVAALLNDLRALLAPSPAEGAGEAGQVRVPLRWVDEVVIALDAASIIGARSCRPGDGLHLANHDRLIREAQQWSVYAESAKSLPAPVSSGEAGDEDDEFPQCPHEAIRATCPDPCGCSCGREPCRVRSATPSTEGSEP